MSENSNGLRARHARDAAELTRHEMAVGTLFNEHLDRLRELVAEFAQEHGGGIEHRRNDSDAVTIAESLTVEFHPQDAGHPGFVSVRDISTGMSCRFETGLPAPAALLGLLRGQFSAVERDLGDW